MQVCRHAYMLVRWQAVTPVCRCMGACPILYSCATAFAYPDKDPLFPLHTMFLHPSARVRFSTFTPSSPLLSKAAFIKARESNEAFLGGKDRPGNARRRNERSVAVTEELEREYGLHPAKGRRREKGQGIVPADYTRGDLKRQVAAHKTGRGDIPLPDSSASSGHKVLI